MIWCSLLSHLQRNRQLSFKQLYILGQYFLRRETISKQDGKRSYEGFVFYLRCACLLALYVRHILSLLVQMARLGMKFFKVITLFDNETQLTEYHGMEAFLFQYFTKSNLVFGLFQWFIFVLAESQMIYPPALEFLTNFNNRTYSLYVLQDRWIFRSKYKCAWRSNRRCSQLDTQGHPADEWDFNVFA